MRIIIAAFLLCIYATVLIALDETTHRGPIATRHNLELDVVQVENWVHREGSVWMNVTNWGVSGMITMKNTQISIQ